MRTLLLTLVLCIALAQTALAAPVNLSGTWVLDSAASDDLEPLLVARGASVLERKAAANLRVTRTIQQDGDTLQINIDTSAKDAEETVKVDGTARQQTTESGEVATVTNRWEGTAWVSESVLVNDAGQTVRVTQTNTLSADGSTMTTHIRFVRGNEAPIVVTRIYRRK